MKWPPRKLTIILPSAREHARNIIHAHRSAGRCDAAIYGSTYRAFSQLAADDFITKARAKRVLKFMRRIFRGEIQ